MKISSKPKRRFISPLRENVDKTIFQHPVFQDVAEHMDWMTAEVWPEIQAMNAAAESLLHQYSGEKIRFSAQSLESLADGLHYEQRIFEKGLVSTRQNNWHDLFNAMIWLKYPMLKSALNFRQWEDAQTFGLLARTPSQCAITLFDEAGAIVIMDDEDMLACWKQHDWLGLFVKHAEAWETGRARVFVFGHALFDHVLVTETLLVAKCLVLKRTAGNALEKDFESLATQIKNAEVLLETRELRTLPLCGIPGWHSNSDSVEFIKTAACFSPLPAKKQTAQLA